MPGNPSCSVCSTLSRASIFAAGVIVMDKDCDRCIQSALSNAWEHSYVLYVACLLHSLLIHVPTTRIHWPDSIQREQLGSFPCVLWQVRYLALYLAFSPVCVPREGRPSGTRMGNKLVSSSGVGIVLICYRCTRTLSCLQFVVQNSQCLFCSVA